MALRGASKVTVIGPTGKYPTRSNALRSGSQKIEGPVKAPSGTKKGLRTDTQKVTIISPMNHSNTDGSLNTK